MVYLIEYILFCYYEKEIAYELELKSLLFNLFSILYKNNLININTASIQELDTLPGIGEATANKIVNYREEKGKFNSIEEIKNVNGIGDKKYEELKQMLEEQGYFDISHKKKIPQMPKIIGVLTSQTGSVIRDIINVSTRRNPNVNIRLFPVPVQGEGAAETLETGTL